MLTTVDRRLNTITSQLNILSPVPVAATSNRTVTGPRVSITSKSNGVAVITINNPPVNSLHPEVEKLLGSLYDECCSDSTILAIVITGGEGNFFMAGADIETVHKNQLTGKSTPQNILAGIKEGMRIFNRFESGPKPTGNKIINKR